MHKNFLSFLLLSDQSIFDYPMIHYNQRNVEGRETTVKMNVDHIDLHYLSYLQDDQPHTS